MPLTTDLTTLLKDLYKVHSLQEPHVYLVNGKSVHRNESRCAPVAQWIEHQTTDQYRGVAQVFDDLGNPLVFTAREVLGHLSQLASICLSTAGFVALLNTVLTQRSYLR